MECGLSWNFEVYVFLNSFTNCLIIRVEWRNFTMYSLCVLLSCYAHQVALIHREFAQHGCFQTDYELQSRQAWSQVALIFLMHRVFRETFLIGLMGTGRFTFNNKHVLHVPRLPWSITDWFWDWLGWLEEFCLSSNFSSWLSNNFTFWLLITVKPNGTFPLVQSWSCRNEIFGGGRGDMLQFLMSDFSSLQSHNFWNTTSWKCSLKDYCIRSSLIEC